jgi:hypothetical protein
VEWERFAYKIDGVFQKNTESCQISAGSSRKKGVYIKFAPDEAFLASK